MGSSNEYRPAGKNWRHPWKLSIRMPRRVAATVAVMQMGLTDYREIAGAVGLTVAEVKRVDSAKDRAVRQLCSVGIPEGEYFKLDETIRCPKCKAMIRIAPCVACVSRAMREAARA